MKNFIKEDWFRISLIICLAFLVFQISTYLKNQTWSYTYSKRAECLERIYSRGNNDSFDSKANCFDIISKIWQQ